MTPSSRFLLAAVAVLSFSFAGELSAQSGSRTPVEAGSATRNVPIESQPAPGVVQDLGSGTRNVPMSDPTSVVNGSAPVAQPVPMVSQPATLSTPMAGGCGCSGDSTAFDYSYNQGTFGPVYGSTYYGGTVNSSGCCTPSYSTRSYFAPSWRYRRSYFGGFRSSNNCCGW